MILSRKPYPLGYGSSNEFCADKFTEAQIKQLLLYQKREARKLASDILNRREGNDKERVVG